MTSAFLSELDIIQVGWRQGRPVWRTHASLCYRSDMLGKTVVIPDDFFSDGASVPRWPLAYLIAGGKGIRSAVLHDFAYQFGFWWCLPRLPRRTLTVDKAVADRVFWESLLADPISGVSARVARLMWGAVRVGGRGVWVNPERAKLLNPVWSSGDWGPPEAP